MITFIWDHLPLGHNLNSRGAWQKTNKLRQAILAGVDGPSSITGRAPASDETRYGGLLVVYEPTHGHKDNDNLIASCKYYLDYVFKTQDWGRIDKSGHFIPDDHLVNPYKCYREYRRNEPGFEIHIGTPYEILMYELRRWRSLYE